MNEQDNLEGYCDGLAAKRPQERERSYLAGWSLGNLDRIEMLAQRERKSAQ